MPRKKGTTSLKRGRPKGSGVKSGSRTLHKCSIEGCSVVKRGDKLRDHQRQNVLWDGTGEPAAENHQEYYELSAAQKLHTDFFRINGYNNLNFPANKSVSKAGPLDKFLVQTSTSKKKRTRLDDNDNIEESDVSESASSGEDEGGDQVDSGEDGGKDAYLNKHPAPPLPHQTLEEAEDYEDEDETISEGEVREAQLREDLEEAEDVYFPVIWGIIRARRGKKSIFEIVPKNRPGEEK